MPDLQVTVEQILTHIMERDRALTEVIAAFGAPSEPTVLVTASATILVLVIAEAIRLFLQEDDGIPYDPPILIPLWDIHAFATNPTAWLADHPQVVVKRNPYGQQLWETERVAWLARIQVCLEAQFGRDHH